ncbi:MAG: hypothetical protein H6730_01375 [Deltaproteobacteria bacterium]|nr:hypothetical protein [Deltaproteobacteria bacterium]
MRPPARPASLRSWPAVSASPCSWRGRWYAWLAAAGAPSTARWSCSWGGSRAAR